MPEAHSRITYDEFCTLVEKIYKKFPEEYQIPIFLQEKMPSAFDNCFYGFHKFDDKAIVLCYWGFRMTSNFSEQHIENVITHELQHFFESFQGSGGNLVQQEKKEIDPPHLSYCPHCQRDGLKLIVIRDKNGGTVKCLQICIIDNTCNFTEWVKMADEA